MIAPPGDTCRRRARRRSAAFGYETYSEPMKLAARVAAIDPINPLGRLSVALRSFAPIGFDPRHTLYTRIVFPFRSEVEFAWRT